MRVKDRSGFIEKLQFTTFLVFRSVDQIREGEIRFPGHLGEIDDRRTEAGNGVSPSWLFGDASR
jgi:hypothetical protein